MSLASTIGTITMAVVSGTFLTLTELFGTGWVFCGFGVICLAIWIMYFMTFPETKGMTLEEMDNIWRKNEKESLIDPSQNID